MPQGDFPLAYFHPTEVVAVDDHPETLRELQRLMPTDMLFRGFDDPEAALAYLEAQPGPEQSLVARAVRHVRSHDADALVHVDFNLIEREIMNPQRFAVTTVLITDYLMPTMSGIALCERLKHRSVKTILLTGIADEMTAVDAFNRGLLDRFVLKSVPDALHRAITYARELQRLWFAEQQSAFLRSPPIASIFGSDVIMSKVHALLEAGTFREYYATIGPPGFIALDEHGNATRILVIDEAERASQHAYACQHRAPRHVVDALATGASVAFYFEKAEDFEADDYPWDSFLAPATRAETPNGTWFVAALPCAPTDIDFDPDESSLAAVLNRR